MTVAELIVWLQTQDQGAIVEVIRHTNGRGWDDQGGNAEVVDFTPEDTGLFEYKDFRNNPFVKEDASYFGKRYLQLGEYNG